LRKYYLKAKSLVLSSTAKDTYVLFSGNVLSAFLGFVYTLILARALSVPDFGIFSAAVNLVVILNSLTDLGISTGAVNFVAESEANGDGETSKKYTKAATVLRLEATLIASLLVIFFAKYIANTFLITDRVSVAILTSLASLSLALPMLLPFVLQARKKFVSSVIADDSLYLSRLAFTFGFMFLAKITIENSLLSFVLGGIVGTIVGIYLIKPDFIKSKPEKIIYKN
jgi:O-antigen/teichoic acid export membrane protein